VLGEREFKRVKNGLDAAQVASFIDELIKERDRLAQSQDHIASLNRLAEMTVVEADRLATQVKTEATEQAKAESTAIIDKAREQARQMMEKRIAEAMEIANEKANAIKAKAEEEAALLLENERNKIRGELRNLVNQQFGYMLEELESLKQRAEAVQADFGNKLSAPREDNSAVTVETAKESDTIVAEEIDAVAAKIAEKSDTLVAEESKALDEHPAPSRATDHVEKGLDLSKLLEIEDQAELSKPQWEVEILPPFDIAKIMEVVSFLDQLPEVANTEMIVPQIDMPSILVFLRESVNFIDVLQTIPAVANVEEVTTDKAATNGEPRKGPRKVRISLLGNTTSQEKK
jgi:cell division septum initiation protein DivIVA